MSDLAIRVGDLTAGNSLPLVVEAAGSEDVSRYRNEIEDIVRRELFQSGAILFRGFGIDDEVDFEGLVNWFDTQMLDYDYASTPRTRVKGNIYTSTEYPPERVIPLHNEMSYTRSWPMKLWFYSPLVAAEGGETPIADSRAIYNAIDPAVCEKFATKKLMYVRNYRAGVDLPWQQVFNTDDHREVEAFCKTAGMEYQWGQNNELQTRQVCQAVAEHPVTAEPVWFNQAHLFHHSALEPRVREALLALYTEQGLPRNVFFGDGSPIPESDLNEIRAAVQSCEVVFSWQQNDVLLVDNMLVAHGRRQYSGDRRVLVAMAQASTSAIQGS